MFDDPIERFGVYMGLYIEDLKTKVPGCKELEFKSGYFYFDICTC